MARLDETAYLVVDTNIFIEFAFQNIDWCAAANYKRVVLLLVPKVISEMDDHKGDAGSDRKRDRARIFGSFLDGLEVDPSTMTAEMPGKKGVQIKIIAKSPKINEYPDLVWESGDDQILASVLGFVKENLPTAKHTFIVSDDRIMRYKAMANHIRMLWNEHISDKRLPVEPSPQQKQIKALDRKVEDLEKRIAQQQPRLTLGLYNAEDEIISTVALQEPEVITEADIKAKIARERRNSETGSSPHNMFVGSAKDWEEYYKDIEDYYRELSIYNVTKSRAIQLHMKLTNSVAPAKDIFVTLRIEHKVALFVEEIMEEPERPEPPKLANFLSYNYYPPVLPDLGSAWGLNKESFELKPKQVTWEVEKLLHNQSIASLSFYLLVPEGMEKVTFPYEIHAANQKDFVKGEIEIIIEED